MFFTILDSIDDLPSPVRHHDARVFPDHSSWYANFEQFVALGNGEMRFAFCYEFACDRLDSGPGSSEKQTLTDQIGDEQDTVLQLNEVSSKITNSCQCVSALLPLYRSKSPLGLKYMRSLENYYSVDFRPLCSCIAAHQYLGPLLNHVLQSESPHMFQLRGLDLDAPETAVVLHALKESGWQPYIGVHQVNWVHDFVGNYDDYIASRPGRLRSTLMRKSAKLNQLPNVKLTVHDGQDDLDQLLIDYKCIYDLSWKVPEPHTRFIPQLISDCAKAGQLRLGLLSIDNKPVAIHFWIVKCGTAFIYKLAHDASYDSYSPGTLLMAHMVKYVMENDGISRLDFLSGDDAYKRDWMSLRREKYVVTAFNPKSLIAQILRLKNHHILPFVKQLALLATKLAK